MNRVFPRKSNGADGVRTRYLLVANQALSQMSYGPFNIPYHCMGGSDKYDGCLSRKRSSGVSAQAEASGSLGQEPLHIPTADPLGKAR